MNPVKVTDPRTSTHLLRNATCFKSCLRSLLVKGSAWRKLSACRAGTPGGLLLGCSSLPSTAWADRDRQECRSLAMSPGMATRHARMRSPRSGAFVSLNLEKILCWGFAPEGVDGSPRSGVARYAPTRAWDTPLRRPGGRRCPPGGARHSERQARDLGFAPDSVSRGKHTRIKGSLPETLRHPEFEGQSESAGINRRRVGEEGAPRTNEQMNK